MRFYLVDASVYGILLAFAVVVAGLRADTSCYLFFVGKREMRRLCAGWNISQLTWPLSPLTVPGAFGPLFQT